MNQEKKDLVTVGEIRKVLNDRLQGQIDVLVKLIKQGCGQKCASEKYLSKIIGQTIDELDELNSWAGLPALIKSLTKS